MSRGSLFSLYICLCCCYYSVVANEIQIEDISNFTSSCHPLDSCEPLPAGGSVEGKRSCRCDSLCAVYGDCCRDAEAYDIDIQRRNSQAHSCARLVEYGEVYIRTQCMEGWTEGDLEAELCGGAAASLFIEDFQIRQDVPLDLPVTSLKTGITYANIHCAICNNDDRNMARWRPRLQCSSLSQNYSRQQVQNHLYYNDESAEWQIPYNRGGDPEGEYDAIGTCEVYPEAPESVQSILRKCERMHTSCSANWTDPNTQELCQNHMARVYAETGYWDSVYRNRFCAICNYINENYIVCKKPLPFGRLRFSFNMERFVRNGFATLLDWSTLIEEPVEPDIFITSGNGTVEVIKKKKDAYTVAVSKLPEDDFVVTQTVEQITECIYLKNGNKLCAYKELGPSTVVLSIISFACLVLSSICLIIHLVVFMIVPDLKNLSGKNLASYSVALLAADISLILGYFGEPGDIECFIVAILKYYFFLASFLWLIIMSSDVCWTIRQSSKNLRIRKGGQRQKFLTYTVCGWFLPIPPLCMAVILDTLDTSYLNGFPLGMIPEFGKLNCWFGQPQALLVFFGSPLAVTMLICTITFVYSARIVYETKLTVRASSTDQQKAFMLYIRLALLSGITWICGLVAACINIVALKYVVVVLNAPQGVFIFLAFTCTSKVRDGLRRTFSRLRCCFCYGCLCCPKMDDRPFLNRKISDSTDQSSTQTHRTSV